jgi:flagellar motor protein MotB
MHTKPCLICLLFLSGCSLLTGQQDTDSTPDVTFDAFKGIVYSMPLEEHDIDPAFVRGVEEQGGLKRDGRWLSRKIADRYSDRVLDYPQIGEITLERINIPETIIGYGVFPGVAQTSRFCMILNSTMYVEREGCYEFSLESDDGSVLWIDDIKVVNNDGGHQMRLVRDSVALTTGVYGARLWYFQGLPDRFGLIFDTRWVGEMSACDALEKRQQYVLNSTLLFNTDQYTLTATAKTALNKLLDTLSQQAIRSTEIIGHTDTIGS